MITLYHSPQSRSSRIIWLLEELGEPYDIRPVSIYRPTSGEGAGDPANPHPDKRVPAIEHDGELVAESVAIVLYLSDAFPQANLGPRAGDKGRGTYLTWLAWYAAEMEPAMITHMLGELDGSPQKQRSYDMMVRRLEEALASSPYIMGEQFTGADLLISSAIAYGRQAFPPSEVLDAYAERCRARPAAMRGVALDNASELQHVA